MEKGKLIIKKTKKGWAADIYFMESGKTMTCPRIKPDDMPADGTIVEVERTQGRIDLVRTKDKIIYGTPNNTSSSKIENNTEKRNKSSVIEVNTDMKIDHLDNISHQDRQARAPYNFIPLNKHFVEAEKLPTWFEITDEVIKNLENKISGDKLKKLHSLINRGFSLEELNNKLNKLSFIEEEMEVITNYSEIPNFNKYYKERHTGWIEVELETKTSLYIRDTLTEDEMKKDDEAKKKNEIFINPDFFNPGNKTRIPGSSLRGMIRNLVEIVSFGKFGFCDDKRRLYFRAVADTSTLGSDYKKIMVNENDNYYPKIKAGILKKVNNNEYKIYPSKTIKGTQIYRVNFNKNTKIVDGTSNFIVPNFNYKEVYFEPVEPKKHTHYRKDRQGKEVPYPLKYAKLTSVSKNKSNNHQVKGYIIASGEFGNKKHLHWVINDEDPNTQPLKIEELIKNYKDDVNRQEDADLLKKLKDEGDSIPCFYILDNQGKVKSFGHTGMFRLAYEKTIGEHIPEELQDPNKIDITEAIFGNEETFAGRVFFEDAFLKDGQNSILIGEKTPEILSSPKPTTFQHYLVQTFDEKKKLNHYNSDASIRGYKLYWHKSGKIWEGKKKEIQDSPKQYTRINPVREGIKFAGKIRFENLSDVELGALLFALDLPQGCCHKMGMGKALGLGSVKITPELFLSDRKKRYESLFGEWDINESKDINKFKKDFEKYVLEKAGENKNSLWEVDRLKDLMAMLNFNRGVTLENQGETDYMQLNEFRNRLILPRPSRIKLRR